MICNYFESLTFSFKSYSSSLFFLHCRLLIKIITNNDVNMLHCLQFTYSLKVLWSKRRSCAWTLREPRESLRVTWNWLRNPSWIWRMTSSSLTRRSRSKREGQTLNTSKILCLTIFNNSYINLQEGLWDEPASEQDWGWAVPWCTTSEKDQGASSIILSFI